MSPGILAAAVCLWAVFGHLAMWVGTFSRLHALGLRPVALRSLELLVFLVLLGVPAIVLLRLALAPPFPFRLVDAMPGGVAGLGYVGLCAACGAVTATRWCWRRWKGSPRELLRCERRVARAVESLARLPCGDAATRLLARCPGNQILELEINVKTLLMPRLPACLDGLTIVHLSDLHFTGSLTRDFFAWVIDQANALDGDLLALTGDIVDARPCLDWVAPVLGRARWGLGALCVFGNHDPRAGDLAGLAAAVERAGWQYLGGRWRELRVRGRSIVVAGNELPWLGPAADMATWSEPADGRRPLRILLSHTPDQIQWARAQDFDLMLAGHTHGGQIQLPVFGPLIAQSLYGVRYACGVFFESPTLLHVSRGISGVQNLRINCRPELTKLVLRCGAPRAVEDPDRAAVQPRPDAPLAAPASRSAAAPS